MRISDWSSDVCSSDLAGLLVVQAWDPPPLRTLRLKTFDLYQTLKPRQAQPQPIIVVDIDDETLAAFGQWPWPRTLVARLVDQLTALGAVVIGQIGRASWRGGGWQYE